MSRSISRMRATSARSANEQMAWRSDGLTAASASCQVETRTRFVCCASAPPFNTSPFAVLMASQALDADGRCFGPPEQRRRGAASPNFAFKGFTVFTIRLQDFSFASLQKVGGGKKNLAALFRGEMRQLPRGAARALQLDGDVSLAIIRGAGHWVPWLRG